MVAILGSSVPMGTIDLVMAHGPLHQSNMRLTESKPCWEWLVHVLSPQQETWTWFEWNFIISFYEPSVKNDGAAAMAKQVPWFWWGVPCARLGTNLHVRLLLLFELPFYKDQDCDSLTIHKLLCHECRAIVRTLISMNRQYTIFTVMRKPSLGE